MGLIKTDPNQNKAVAVLLGILVIAIGVTVFRVIGARETPVAARAAQSSTGSESAISATAAVRVFDRNRNPFRKPAGVSVVENSANPMTLSGMKPMPASSSLTAQTGNIGVLPMPVDVSNAAPAAKRVASAHPKLVFVLHATIEDSRGACAVISANGSEPRVIALGERIDGYKLIAVDEDRAVLENGRDTVIANRPKA